MAFDVEQWVIASRRRQGLPDHIEDPAWLARTAGLIAPHMKSARGGRTVASGGAVVASDRGMSTTGGSNGGRST